MAERTKYSETHTVFTDYAGDVLRARFFGTDPTLYVQIDGAPGVDLSVGQQMALVRMILERHNGPTYPGHPMRRSYDVPNV